MLLYFSLAVFLSTADAACYKPTGVDQGKDFVPCNSFDASNSFCCGAGRTDGLPNDVCMPNGLCSQYEVNATNIDTMQYWREGCSNPDWPEAACLNVCPDPSQNDSNGNAPITPCDGTPTSRTWCCGKTRDCCGKGGPDEIVLQQTLVAAPTPNRPSSTATTSASSASTSTQTSASVASTDSTTSIAFSSTTTSTNTGYYTQSGVAEYTQPRGGSQSSTSIPSPSPTADSQGLSTGAVAGIGVAAGAAGVALFGGLILLCLRRRGRARAGGGLVRHNSVSPSESASQHPLGQHSAVGYASNPVSHVGYPHSAPGGPPMPPPPFSPTNTTTMPGTTYPHATQTMSIFPKYEVGSQTAELGTDRPLRELPADSAIGYYKS